MSDATLPELTAGGGAAALLSDDRLARRATRGDRRAFAAIYRRYHQPLFRYCAAILGNPDDAHDALQNTMVRVLRALPGERRHVRLKPWLYRIAHNESVELLRRRRPLEQLDPEMVLDEGDPAESAAARERLRRLIGDLDELPERQRGALVMRELGGLSFEQIGEAFSTSPAVARQTVYEARLGLQQMSEGREMLCDEVCRALSDGDRRVARRRDIRAHLRSCEGCRSFREGIEQRRRDLAAIAPLPPLAAVGLFHSLVAGGAGSGAGAGVTGAAAGSSGLGGSAGGLGAASSFGKAIAGSALLKGAATVAVVAAVGISAADRSGVIHVLPGEGGGAAKAGGESAPAEGGHGSGSAAAVGGTAGAASAGGASQGTASGFSQGSARKALGHHAPTPATVGQGGQPGSATHGAGGSAAVPGSQGARGAAHGQAAATHGHSGASTAHGQGATRSGEHRSQSHGSSAAAAPGSKGNAHGKGATRQHQSHSKSKHEAGSNAKHGKGKPPTGSSQATSHQGNPPEAGQTAPQAGSRRGASQVTPPASTPEPEVGVDAPSGPAAAGTLAEGVE